jgi:hypothetical protein
MPVSFLHASHLGKCAFLGECDTWLRGKSDLDHSQRFCGNTIINSVGRLAVVTSMKLALHPATLIVSSQAVQHFFFLDLRLYWFCRRRRYWEL